MAFTTTFRGITFSHEKISVLFHEDIWNKSKYIQAYYFMQKQNTFWGVLSFFESRASIWEYFHLHNLGSCLHSSGDDSQTERSTVWCWDQCPVLGNSLLIHSHAAISARHPSQEYDVTAISQRSHTRSHPTRNLWDHHDINLKSHIDITVIS